MRLKENEIEYTAWRVLKILKERDEIIFLDSEDPVLQLIMDTLTAELKREDDLNREVEDRLLEYQDQIQRDSVDGRRMFQLVKKQLAKELAAIGNSEMWRAGKATRALRPKEPAKKISKTTKGVAGRASN